MHKLIIFIKRISHRPIKIRIIYISICFRVTIAQFQLSCLSSLRSSSNRTKSMLQCRFPHLVDPSHINGANLVVSPTLQTVENATGMTCMHNSPLHCILQNMFVPVVRNNQVLVPTNLYVFFLRINNQLYDFQTQYCRTELQTHGPTDLT